LKTQTSPLDLLRDDVAALLRRGFGAVAVFDLDDTLLSTERRHQRILREFGLGEVPRSALRYQIVDTARAAGVADEAELSRLRDFWFKRFFQNDYLVEDAPVAGGPEYCRDLALAGATVVYMTGRDEGMRRGTLASLEKHRFPMPDGKSVRLVLKPRFEDNDAEFKTKALEELAAWGEVAGAFENEPLHVNLFGERFRDARLYLLETKHSGKPVEAHPKAHRIKDFVRR
jgi:hypothetical protein